MTMPAPITESEPHGVLSLRSVQYRLFHVPNNTHGGDVHVFIHDPLGGGGAYRLFEG